MLNIPPERLVALHLIDRSILVGRVRDDVPGWLRLLTVDGERLVNLAHVISIDLNEGASDPGAQIDSGIPRPRSKDAPVKVGSKAPGRPWTDADLKDLAEGFLDGKQDADLALAFHRTRNQIRDLRQGFEVNRGNLVEEQVTPAATTWVNRWQRVLAP